MSSEIRKIKSWTSASNNLVYDVSEFQQFLWEDHKENEPAIQPIVHEGRMSYEAFDKFSEEVFHRLYSKKEHKLEEPPPATEWAQRLHSEIEKLPEFRRLQERCCGKEWWAGMGAGSIIKNVVGQTALDKQIKDAQTQQRALEYLKRLLEESKEVEEQVNLKKNIKKLQKQIQKKTKDAQEAADRINGSEIRNAFREAIKKANQDINQNEQVHNALSSLAGDGTVPGRIIKGGINPQLIRMISQTQKLQKIMELAGRLERIAEHKQKEKARKGTNEISGIIQGDDIARLLPSEAFNIIDPARELIFAQKLTEKALVQYQLEEKPEKKKGPIVMLIDASGSMSGDSEAWAGAVSLAFANIAYKQQRTFAILHFDTKVKSEFISKVKERKHLNDLVSAINHRSSGGGTDFKEPIMKAVYLIGNEKHFEDADIIMITDGNCHIDDDWVKKYKELKDRLKFKLYSILVGVGYSVETCKKFSDQTTILVEALKEDAKIHDLFKKV